MSCVRLWVRQTIWRMRKINTFHSYLVFNFCGLKDIYRGSRGWWRMLLSCLWLIYCLQLHYIVPEDARLMNDWSALEKGRKSRICHSRIQNRRLRLIDCSVCSFIVSLQFPFNNASQLHSSSSIHGLRMSCSAPLRMPSVKLIIHFAQPVVDLGHLFIFSRPINWLFEESSRTFEMGEDHHLLRNHHCL